MGDRAQRGYRLRRTVRPAHRDEEERRRLLPHVALVADHDHRALADARALKPIHERPVFGRSVLLFDGAIKLVPWPVVTETMDKMGYGASDGLARSLGLITIVCTALYALPPDVTKLPPEADGADCAGGDHAFDDGAPVGGEFLPYVTQPPDYDRIVHVTMKIFENERRLK